MSDEGSGELRSLAPPGELGPRAPLAISDLVTTLDAVRATRSRTAKIEALAAPHHSWALRVSKLVGSWPSARARSWSTSSLRNTQESLGRSSRKGGLSHLNSSRSRS